MPLGVLREAIFVENTIRFPAKARLLLYTDGVTEGRNTEGEAFGVKRLQRWFAHQVGSAKTPEELKQDLVAQLAEFEARATLQDDRTFLVAAEE